MKTKWISQKPKTLAIVFDAGDEVMDGLLKVARESKLAASQFTAIGAFQSVILGFFESPTHLRRHRRPEAGLALIDLDAGS